MNDASPDAQQPLELDRWDGRCVRCATVVPYDERYNMFRRECAYCYHLGLKDD